MAKKIDDRPANETPAVNEKTTAPAPEHDRYRPGFLYVTSAPGTICPKELSRERITDRQPEHVPNNAYYRRLVAEGSLVLK